MLEKEINDILKNGNANTAVERLAKLFEKHSERPREIEQKLTKKVALFVDDPELLTPSELVDMTTKDEFCDHVLLVLAALAGAFLGAVVMYVLGGAV